jgi:[protein-PII] uridylyltransferase
VERLLRGRPRPAPPTRAARILPAVFFDNQASETATLVEIVAEDRPGLLYELARTFTAAMCSIDVVLIDTEAHKAIDVFYVTFRQGKIPAEVQSHLQGELLRVCNA